MTVLLTGASGFVGRRLSAELLRRGQSLRIARRPGTTTAESADTVEVGGTGLEPTNWTQALGGCSAVVHLAARAHQIRERHPDPEAAFHTANVVFACACAEAAAAAGAKRFVFVSTIGVHGGSSAFGPLHPDSPPAPHTAYARSKWQAEQALVDIARRSGMALTVVRPPLVYGPGAPGNFGRLLHLVARGQPLPLASVIHNRRSLVALDNLVDLLITCLNHPAAANQVFLAGDGEDVSTADLLRRLGLAMGRPARLWPVPTTLLSISARLLGKADLAQSLLGDLQLDITHTRQTLGWTPPITLNEGLRRAAAGTAIS